MKGDVEGRHDLGTLSIAVGGVWLRGEVSWYQDGNRGASCKVSLILAFLSLFRRKNEITVANYLCLPLRREKLGQSQHRSLWEAQ